MISAMYFALMGLTCILLAAVAPITDYYLKPEFMMSNGYVMVIGLVFTVLVCCILKKNSGNAYKFESFLKDHSAKILPICTLLLFAAEVVFVSSGFFYSDWDPAGVLDAVYKIMHHDQMAINADYFSAHPNNLMLVWIYVIVLKIASVFGTESVLAISVFQCLLFSLTGVLIFYTVYRVFRSSGAKQPFIMSWITWIIYAVVVGMSPWLIITYSDQVGLIFPVLILYIAVRMRYILPEEKGQEGEGQISAGGKMQLGKYGAWGLIGVLSAIGYSIKPQTVIVSIAVIIVELVHFFASFIVKKRNPASKSSEHLKYTATSFAFMGVSLILVHLFIVKAVYPSLGIPLNSDKEFGMPHYIMMGLNPETDGVYSNDDTNFTNELPRPERGRKNMEVARKRLDEYGAAGFIRHLFRKTMINFGDGTFAWGIDGNFFAGTDFGDMPYVSSNVLTPHILAWIQVGAEHNALFSLIEQGMWLTILVLSLFAALPSGCVTRMFHSKKSVMEDMTEQESVFIECSWFRDVVLLTLLGLFIFELIFEAKARYLFIYVPFWIIAAVMGIYLQMFGKTTAEIGAHK